MSDTDSNSAINPQYRGLIPWKPGQSGNPSGRPPKPLTDRLIARLMKEEGIEAEQVIGALLHSAKNPKVPWSVKAATEIFDRVEGKVADRLTGENGGELIVKIVAVGRE